MNTKKILGILFSLAIIATLLPATPLGVSAADYDWYGDGSADTYNISTAAQLASLADIVNNETDNFYGKTINLTESISLSAYGSGFNEGKGWIPIGTYDTPFRGTFNGGSNTITGLYINCNDYEDTGLFGDLSRGVIKNLNVTGVEIYGNSYIGAIAGYSLGETLIENCYSSGIINTTGSYAGGILGSGGYTSNRIKSCSSDCVVSGTHNIGGLVGDIFGGLIENCYATGDVSGKGCIGGIAGYIEGDIENCYATGNVRGEYCVGGIVGYSGGAAKNCAALNTILEGMGDVGRVVGYNDEDTLTNNYAYADMIVRISGENKTIQASGNMPDGLSATITDISTPTFWTTSLGFDATDYWKVEENKLPILKNISATQDGTLPSFIFVTVSPGTVIISVGGTQQFTAEVIGTGPPSQNVTWSVSGNSHEETKISTNGLLTVGANELSTRLTVRATCVADERKYCKVDVAVVPDADWFTNPTANRYYINSPQQLQALQIIVNRGLDTFRGKIINLTCDLELSGEWVPIGDNSNNVFMGVFDGNDYKISGLYIDENNYKPVGLFGEVIEGTIKNLILENVDVTGVEYVGGVVGSLNNGTIERCFVTGTINGSGHFIGGVVGCNDYGNIRSCNFTGSVNGSEYVGGIVGLMCGACVENCYVSGTVNGEYYVGGISGGMLQGLNIKKCYAVNVVSGKGCVGGIIGIIWNGTVENCVALNLSVIGTNEVGRVIGGLAETQGTDGTLNCYALDTMTVMEDDAVKALNKGADNPDGADVTMEAAKVGTFWISTMGWGEEIWTFVTGMLPALVKTEIADVSINAGAHISVLLSRAMLDNEVLMIATYNGSVMPEIKILRTGDSLSEIPLASIATANKISVMWCTADKITPACRDKTFIKDGTIWQEVS